MEALLFCGRRDRGNDKNICKHQGILTKCRLLPIGRYFDMFAAEYYA